MTHPSVVLSRNLLLEAELRRIVRAFHASGIELAVLKGVPLTRRIYPDLGARPVLDNDLVVHRADAGRAHSLLSELGYDAVLYRSLDSRLRVDFEFTMTRDVGAGAAVLADLHWAIFTPQLYRVPEALVWSRMCRFALGDVTINVPDEMLTIVHLAAHFAQHHFEVPRILEDLAHAWNAWAHRIDSANLESLAEACGQADALGFALATAGSAGLLRAQPPPLRSHRIRLLQRLLPADALLRSGAGYRRLPLAMALAKPRRVLSWARFAMFPPVETMGIIYGRPPGLALYALYLTRPFRVLARLMGLGAGRARTG